MPFTVSWRSWSSRAALTEQMHAQAEAGRLQEAEETAQLWEILCGVLDQFVEILGEELYGAGGV